MVSENKQGTSNTTVAPNTGPFCPTKQARFLFPRAYGSVQDLFNRVVASFCRRLELVYVAGVYGVTSSFCLLGFFQVLFPTKNVEGIDIFEGS